MDFQFLLPFIEYHILVESTCFLRLLSPDYWGKKALGTNERERDSCEHKRAPSTDTCACSRRVFTRGVSDKELSVRGVTTEARSRVRHRLLR